MKASQKFNGRLMQAKLLLLSHIKMKKKFIVDIMVEEFASVSSQSHV